MQTNVASMPESLKEVLSALHVKFWVDGSDEQEDELDDLKKGVLDAPTDVEGAGEIKEDNKDVALIEEIEGEPVETPKDPDALKDYPGFK